MKATLAGWLSWLEHHPYTPKGWGFNSWSGHIPRLWFSTQLGYLQEATNVSLSLSLSLSLSQINNKTISLSEDLKRKEWKHIYHKKTIKKIKCIFPDFTLQRSWVNRTGPVFRKQHIEHGPTFGGDLTGVFGKCYHRRTHAGSRAHGLNSQTWHVREQRIIWKWTCVQTVNSPFREYFACENFHRERILRQRCLHRREWLDMY